jgi:hypothetical protein
MFGVEAVSGPDGIDHQSTNSRLPAVRFVRVMRIRIAGAREISGAREKKRGAVTGGATRLCVASAGSGSVEGWGSTWSTAHDHPMMPPT